MSTFECTFEEFKRIAKDFHDAAPTLNEDELENAWKAVGLAYLGMGEEMWDVSSVVLYEMEARVYWRRAYELAIAEAEGV